MAVLKNAGLVAFAQKALQEGWGYVWSAQGHFYTEALAKEWGQAKRAGMSEKYYTSTCKKWFDHYVADCSGLIIAAFRSMQSDYADQASGTLMKRCTESGNIGTIPEIPGLCVWRKNHIGIYIGNGYVIEAAGVDFGVVKTPIKSPAKGYAWTKWGKLKDVEYPAEEGESGETTETTFTRELQLTYTVSGSKTGRVNMRSAPGKTILRQVNEGEQVVYMGTGEYLKIRYAGQTGYIHAQFLKRQSYMTGDDVKAVQTALNAAGFDCGNVDGVFGLKTAAAAAKFQAAKKLTVDGIVGKNTWAALF